MLFSLALFPAIALLIYIYRKDKLEKEPMKLLLKCFFLGLLAMVPIVIVELILDFFVEEMTVIGSVPYAIADAFLVAGLVEESFKYLVLKRNIWKNAEFNCMFDGIVYSVFVSLGFAAVENVLYVTEGDFVTAITRMFSSVPGHMAFSVFMGYFLSKAKIAELEGDRQVFKAAKRKALLVPIILHGIYDALLMIETDVVGDVISVLFTLGWFVYIIVLLIYTFSFVSKASKSDKYFVQGHTQESPILYSASMAGTWGCVCGTQNQRHFCVSCGKPRPLQTSWMCPECGVIAYWDYCGCCGTKRA